MSPSAPSIEQVLALTNDMLHCAEKSDWDLLVQLEQRRLPLLQEVFDNGVGRHADQAREILSIDEKTRALVSAAMPVLQEKILAMRNSGRANTAYQTVSELASDRK